MPNPEIHLIIRDGVPSLAEGEKDLYCPWSLGQRHCGRWCPLLIWQEGHGSHPPTVDLRCAPKETIYDVIVI